MKIALLADSHNNWTALEQAVVQANSQAIDMMLFAGDLTRPAGVDKLAAFSGPVHLITGNCDYDTSGISTRVEASNNVIFHGKEGDIESENLCLYMNHYPEPAEQQAAKPGVYDVCMHGHSHKFRSEVNGDTRLVNPGALAQRSSSPKWAAYDTETDSVVVQDI